jgi:hypothetical protein
MEVHSNAHPTSTPLYTKWGPIIESHKSRPNTEIEIRFGRRSGSAFDTNVGPETFAKVKRALEKYSEWEETRHTNATVYYFAGSKRLTVDEETDEQSGLIKKRVKVDDFPIENSPFDVRLGVSTEEPFEYDGDEESTEQKTKERWSFVRKNLSIDLTVVKGTPDDKDAEEDTVFQIEMEIMDPSALKSGVETYNLIHKVFDLLKCV